MPYGKVRRSIDIYQMGWTYPSGVKGTHLMRTPGGQAVTIAAAANPSTAFGENRQQFCHYLSGTLRCSILTSIQGASRQPEKGCYRIASPLRAPRQARGSAGPPYPRSGVVGEPDPGGRGGRVRHTPYANYVKYTAGLGRRRRGVKGWRRGPDAAAGDGRACRSAKSPALA